MGHVTRWFIHTYLQSVSICRIYILPLVTTLDVIEILISIQNPCIGRLEQFFRKLKIELIIFWRTTTTDLIGCAENCSVLPDYCCNFFQSSFRLPESKVFQAFCTKFISKVFVFIEKFSIVIMLY